MLFFYNPIMRDLIRNYKMLLRRKSETDTDTSEPLVSRSCSTSSRQSFGSVATTFREESDMENATFPQHIPIASDNNYNNTTYVKVSKYDSIDDIYGKYEQYDILTGEKTFMGFPGVVYDYRDETNDEPRKQNSLVTIFAIWNTTMGSSLLAMAWGVEKSGLLPAILINILIAAICLYTTHSLLKINEKHGLPMEGEVSDLCRSLIGPWAEYLAKVFSLVVLVGANVVYWILMSNFLYNSVKFVHDFLLFQHDNDGMMTDNPLRDTVICPKNDSLVLSNTTAVNPVTAFDRLWDLHSTVPVILGLVMFPMLNWKSATFFTKFNSLGTVSVLYLLSFVGAKSASWGVHVTDWAAELSVKPTFFALSGMLSLSYFIHNIIITIMRSNKRQENNGRDLSIAFGLVTFTYLFIGVLFYVTFPLPKFCIEDNLLNNFDKSDILTIVARILLLFQLFTVFPLMTYMLRNDVFANVNAIFKNYRFGDFSYGRVAILNAAVLTVCILFACFLPRIGTLIRYTGALSGLVYIFMLPSLLKMASLRKEGKLTNVKYVFHVGVIVAGVLNLFSQFFISD